MEKMCGCENVKSLKWQATGEENEVEYFPGYEKQHVESKVLEENLFHNEEKKTDLCYQIRFY